MNQIKSVLEGIYKIKELRKTVIPLFISKPGIGKTSIIESFMKEKGVYRPPFVLSQRMPFEISGMAMVDKENDKMKYYDFDFILDLKDGDILFIDEVTNSNPVTLNAFLTFLESRVTISGKKLPDIMIVGAGNREGMTPLTPQIKERFVWYQIEFDKQSWIEYMIKKYNITLSIGEKLAKLIKDEDFSSENFYTPRSVDKALNMIINNVFTPYEHVLSSILSELITNKFSESVYSSNGVEIQSGQMISWLKLIKMINK